MSGTATESSAISIHRQRGRQSGFGLRSNRRGGEQRERAEKKRERRKDGEAGMAAPGEPVRRMQFGPLDLWTSGPLDLWTSGPLDLWTSGPLDRL